MRTRHLQTVLVVAGLLIANSTLMGIAEAESNAKASHVDLQWSQIHRGPRDPVAAAQTPNRGLVTVAMIDSYRGFTITRSNRHGHHSWAHAWRGPGSRIKGVVGQAVTVGREHRAVLVAGQATCRFQGDELGSLGPIFVRSYDLGGAPQWTRWIGRCPPRPAERHVRALVVSGIDTWPGGIALAFTQGTSYDCCPHRRQGHVVALGFGGAMLWRTDLRFSDHRVGDVATSDIAASTNQLAVTGSVERKRYNPDAFILGISIDHGSVVWRHVTNGKSEPNNDQYTNVDAVGSTFFAVSTLDGAFEGGTGRNLVERWNPSGDRAWRTSVPPYMTVAAQPNHTVIWSGPIWKHHHRNQIAFGMQRADGSSAWRQRRLVPRGDFPYDYHFVATRHHGFSVAEVDNRSRQFLQTWAWSWE